MPMSPAFQKRLNPILPEVVRHFGTPFHIYDECGIRETGQQLIMAFNRLQGFREYFAVKALPNPRILEIMLDMGFGLDCSSIAELAIGRKVGAGPDDIMFTSNNTSQLDFQEAAQNGGCILNLDDISLLPKIPRLPELICFRYNPGPLRTGNDIIGKPVEAKYGVADHQILDAYDQARRMGAKRFGLHTMLASNELNHTYIIQTVEMLLGVVEGIMEKLGIEFEFINIGGGLGIPYRPEDDPLNLDYMADQIVKLLQAFESKHNTMPKLYMESGRYMTGPHGVLVTQAINRKEIYRTYVGVDACMSALMRPGMYGAYHHITVLNKNSASKHEIVDVVGSLCENNDKFAIQRSLPVITDGDILCIHDSGAHGWAMGFNYNGKLRPKELLLRVDGTVELIRREETVTDYFATLNFKSNHFTPKITSPLDTLCN
jgi:diaminopimelate decarboxylase